MSEGNPSTSPRCAKLRRLGPQVEAAFRVSMEQEGSPTYAELEARYQELENQYEALARQIWETPVTSWQDIVERAEIAYAYANEDPAKARLADDLGTRAAAELIMAVLMLVGGTAWRRSEHEPSPEPVS